MSTSIGWNVNGTGVNGNGTLTCAAIAVRMVTKSTAAACWATRSDRDGAPRVSVASRVGCMTADLNMRTALTIAGSDPSGGAGIQADLKTFAAFGVYGASAVTAITVQNTLGVEAVAPLAADLVIAQIEASAGD